LDDLYKVKKTDIKKAGEVLGDSFKEDPIWAKFIKENNNNYRHDNNIIIDILL
jgi:hypothetical protein